MIGIGSPTFSLQPVRENLERISKHFELWEILSEGETRLGTVDSHIEYGRSSFGMSFQVHAPMSDVNIGSVYEPMRLHALDEIRDVIDRCRKLEISLVTVHPGFVNGIAFLNRSKALEMTKVSVKKIAEISREHSVAVVIENLPTGINATCTTASDLLSVVEGTGLQICFDMGHANTAGQLDQFLLHVDKFGNVHLHNNSGDFDEHSKIDDGTADLRKVVQSLRRTYRGNIVIEATDLESGVESKKVLEGLLG